MTCHGSGIRTGADHGSSRELDRRQAAAIAGGEVELIAPG